MDCVFNKTDKGYQCPNCGVTKRKKTRRNCGLKKGFGDTVSNLTKAVGIKPCGACNKRRAKLNNLTATPAYRNARLIPTAELIVDAVKLAEQVPPEIDGVCGIPRSGMIPASVIAAHLHLPLYTYYKGQVKNVGNGSRLDSIGGRNLLFVDDTTMIGNTLKKLESVKGLKASVYVNPHSARKPDLYTNELEPPHLLEWNLFNSGYCKNMAFDMDGVICHDQPRKLWGKQVERPRYLPRRSPVTIITARLERDRLVTESWLKDHGVTVEKLVMFPGNEADRLKPRAISEYKAEAFKESGKDWYVESCSQQAREIAELTGAWVICTENGEVY